MSDGPILHQHGIQNDESDYRLHVSFGTQNAYLFPTKSGALAVQSGRYPTFEAGQPGVNGVTGRGYKVPWNEIEGCREIRIPADILPRISRDDKPGDKGRAAMQVATQLLALGVVSLPTATAEVEEKDMQIRGTDLIVTSRLKIQVKCDWWGGKSGLRLQTAERNPLHIH